MLSFIENNQISSSSTLDDNEHRFKMIVENFFGGIFIVDNQFRVVYVNEELCRMFGDKKENIVGRDFREFLDEESKTLVVERYLQRLKGEDVPSKYELNVRNHENQKCIVEISATLLKNSKGDTETICHMIDITEQKNTVKRLRDSKERLRTLFEYAPDAYYITDLDGNFLEGNKAAESMIGYGRQELIGKNYLAPALLVPGQEAKAKDVLKRCTMREYTGPIEFELQHKNGSKIIVEIRTAPYNLDGNKVLLGIARDITKRKSAQKELDRLASVIEQVNNLVVITELDGTVLYVNGACENIWCRPAAEIIGKHFLDQDHGVQNPELIDEMWQTLGQGDSWQGVIIREKAEGRKVYEEINAFPIKNSDGEITNYAAVNQDITEDILLKEQLQQKQRLESIGHMASGVAHDFNNILNVILGYSEIVLGKTEQEHSTWKYVNEVAKASKRASELTKQLLAFSRKQVFKPQIISINTLITDMLPMFQKMTGEEISIDWDFTPHINPIKADPIQLEQVMMNLVLNSRDAIRENKSNNNTRLITIKTSELNISNKESQLLHDLNNGTYAMIEVHDTGIGIPSEIIAHIFDPFFTTKKTGEGTGLGLSTVYGIVKQNKGTLRVSSEEKKGTKFKIYWPIHTQAIEYKKNNKPRSQIKPIKATILAVEDDPAILSFIEYILDKTGYGLITAKNGIDAQTQAVDSGKNIDLLFTDIVMPEMDGRELASKLTKKFPEINVLYASGYSNDIILQNGKLKKNEYFIQKPYTARVLLETIDSIMIDKDK